MTTASSSAQSRSSTGSSSRPRNSTMARFSARLTRPSRVRRVGLPRVLSTRWARPSIEPRPSGAGLIWVTKVTRDADSKPARKRSERLSDGGSVSTDEPRDSAALRRAVGGWSSALRRAIHPSEPKAATPFRPSLRTNRLQAGADRAKYRQADDIYRRTYAGSISIVRFLRKLFHEFP